MAAIKLLKIGTMDDGVVRLQSTLFVGTNVANFIIEGGVIKTYGHGNKGFNFYEYTEPYEIVPDIKGMKQQELQLSFLEGNNTQ